MVSTPIDACVTYMLKKIFESYPKNLDDYDYVLGLTVNPEVSGSTPNWGISRFT